MNGVAHALARFGWGVERELLGIKQLIRPADICIDIGAARGLYTEELARFASMVHSVEPLPYPDRRIRKLPNVRRHKLALAAIPQRADMLVPAARGRSFLGVDGAGYGANSEFGHHDRIPVEVDTLDALCARENIDRIDFVKIDVEGAELDVLRGGEHILDACRPAMMLEIEERHQRRYGRGVVDIFVWFNERGYEASAWDGSGWRWAAFSPQIRNYLFRPLS